MSTAAVKGHDQTHSDGAARTMGRAGEVAQREVVARTHPIAQQLEDQRSRGERLADRIAELIGSWRFLIVQSVCVALWIGINVLGLALGWDPYPFVLLNLLFSVQAAYTGPVLLLSQNRSAQRDRIMAEHDYATNEKAEKLIEAMMSELLRNSQAVLAIAAHHGISLQALATHEEELTQKADAIQAQLAEVEDVLAGPGPDTARHGTRP